jgi:hypothetical protein
VVGVTDLAALLVQFLAQVSVPPEAERLLGDLPRIVSTEGAALYGGGALGVGALWRLVRNARAVTDADQTVGGGTSVSTRSTGSSGGSASLGKDKAAFTLPGFLPLSKGIREVTHNEIHALELGFVAGFVVAWLYTLGRTNVAVGLAVTFVGGSLGYKRYKTKAFATIRLEPWYAMLALLGGAGAGWAFFTQEVTFVF